MLKTIIGMTLNSISLSPESVGGGVRGAMPLEYLEEDYEAGVDALPQQLRFCICKIIILKSMLAGLCFRICGSLATSNSRSSWSWSSRSSTCLSRPTSTFSRSLPEVNRSVTTVLLNLLDERLILLHLTRLVCLPM